MPRDLFAEMESQSTPEVSQEPAKTGRDLFAENPSIAAVPGVEGSTEDSVPSSPFMAAVSGFNKTVENHTVGLWQGVAKAVDEDLGTNLQSHITDYMSRKEAELQGMRKINPTAVLIGEVTAGTGLALASGAAAPGLGLVAGGAAAGAVAGLTQYQEGEKNVLSDVVNGAVGGAVAGSVLKGVGMLASTIGSTFKGLKLAFQDADSLVDNAISKSIQGKPVPSIAEAQKLFTEYTSAMKSKADDLYTARNNIAASLGIDKVPLNNVKAVLNNTDEFLDPTVANYAKQLINNPEVNYKTAQTLVSKFGGKANMAFRSGDDALGADFDKLKKAVLKDSDIASLGNETLANAQSIANSFYKNSYKPLRNEQTKLKLIDGFTNENFVESLIRRSASDPNTQKAMASLPTELRQTLFATHLAATKAAKVGPASTGYAFNVGAYGKSIEQELAKYPILKTTGMDIGNIARIAEAKGLADKAKDTGLLGMGSLVGGAMAGGAGSPLVAANMLWRAKFLHAAGKVLNNPDMANSLKILRSGNAPAPIAKVVSDKIGNALSAAVGSFTSQLGQTNQPEPTEVTAGIRG